MSLPDLGMALPERVSVVVASFRSPELLAQCVESLRPQCARFDAELIVARAPQTSDEALGEIVAGCRVVTTVGGADIPRLRGLGLAQAQGDWVMVMEDHCVADAGWLAALVGAAGPEVQVLGGSMGNAQRNRATDCGAFFAEYGCFGANRPQTAVGSPPRVTGANVAYHRSVVAEVAEWASQGSWEGVIHDRLYAAGRHFRVVPSALVRQNQRYRLADFCRESFRHGREYGATRAAALSALRRMLLFAGTPALPFLLAARIRQASDSEERRHFVRALPATLTFLSAWSLGEAAGYLRGRR